MGEDSRPPMGVWGKPPRLGGSNCPNPRDFLLLQEFTLPREGLWEKREGIIGETWGWLKPSLEGLPLKLPSRGRLRPPHPLQTGQRTIRRDMGAGLERGTRGSQRQGAGLRAGLRSRIKIKERHKRSLSDQNMFTI